MSVFLTLNLTNTKVLPNRGSKTFVIRFIVILV